MTILLKKKLVATDFANRNELVDLLLILGPRLSTDEMITTSLRLLADPNPQVGKSLQMTIMVMIHIYLLPLVITNVATDPQEDGCHNGPDHPWPSTQGGGGEAEGVRELSCFEIWLLQLPPPQALNN